MSTGVKNSKQSKAQQAQWNVQVVRGKVTTRCLWNACKALSIGLLLLTIGTTMAVVGYYADQLSIRSEIRGNSTVKIKNESRGFHLNNLSYAGPIVMGIGGFIVVAACVMTFEARDSAAKVVPARFKPNVNSSVQGGSTKSTLNNSRTFQRIESKRSASCQTPGKSQGIYKVETSMGGNEWSPKNGRKAFTAAFVQFSRDLIENSSPLESNCRSRGKTCEKTMKKSPSAPNLAAEKSGPLPLNQEISKNTGRRLISKASPRTSQRSQREAARPLDEVSSNLLLRPNFLQRQALSMDNPFYESYDCCTTPSMILSRQHSKRSESKDSVEMELGSSAGVSGSQASMALDLHDCQVTLKVKDETANKRSDTARRHQLLRQKPVDDDRDDKISKCSCASRCLYTPTGEDCSIKTKSSLNLKSPCRHCPRAGGRSPIPKISADLRSQSFSQTCSYTDTKKHCFHENPSRIFCIEDHRMKANLSSENVRICCEEKLKCLKRQSPTMSPQRSPRHINYECRAQRFEGSECLVHRRSPQGSHPLVRANAKRRRSSQKIEGSLSAEDQSLYKDGKKEASTSRSASLSPTRNPPTSPFTSRTNSIKGCSTPQTTESSSPDNEKLNSESKSEKHKTEEDNMEDKNELQDPS